MEDDMPAMRLSSDEWLGQLALDLFDAPKRRVKLLHRVLTDSLLPQAISVILSQRNLGVEGTRCAQAVCAHRRSRLDLRCCDVPDELARRLAERNWPPRPRSVHSLEDEPAMWWDGAFPKPAPVERGAG